jgi:hypothetical protein
MKRIAVALTLAFAAAVTLTGCSAIPPVGVVFTSVGSPGHFATGETTNPGGSVISGESCATSILGLAAFGDYSIDAALKAAGAEGQTLKNVAVDGSTFSILGLYVKACTTVNAHVAM